MTPAQRYRKALEVTLTTGDVITVRPLNKTDWVSIGEFPSTLSSGDADRVFKGGSDAAKRAVIERDAVFWESLVKCAITRCITSAGLRVVDKPPGECTADELAFDEMSQLDQTAIATAVLRASGLIGKEVPPAATFPEKQEVAAGSGLGLETLRSTPEPTP